MLSMTQSWFSIGIGPRLRDDKGARGGFVGRTGYQYSYDALYVCVVHEVAVVGVEAAGLFYEVVVVLREPAVKVPSCF